MSYAFPGLALVVGVLASGPRARQEAKPSTDAKTVVYESEVVPARAKRAGWASADASDAQVVEGAVAVVRRRLEALGRSFRVERKPETRTIEFTLSQVEPREREPIADMLESLGLCEFLVLAEPANVAALGLDLDAEHDKLDAWREANPAQPLSAFHALGGDAAPHRRLLWLESRWEETPGPPMAALLPERVEDHFGAVSIARAYRTQATDGGPAIGIEFSAARVADYERFTGAHKGQRLGIVLEGQVRCAPTLNEKVSRSAIIEGRFTEEETGRLAYDGLRKRLGPLKVLDIR